MKSEKPSCFFIFSDIMLIFVIPGLDEAQAGNKMAGRNSNNLRYADDTTLKTENEEEQMKVKEEGGKS